MVYTDYDRWYRPGLHLIRTYYVYLRTRIGVEHDSAAIDAIEAMLGTQPEMLSPDAGYTPFSNGFVFRVIGKQLTAKSLV